MFTNHSQRWRDRPCHWVPPIGEIEPTARVSALSYPILDRAAIQGDVTALSLLDFMA